MKRTKLLPYLLLSNSVGVLVATSALAEVTPISQSPIIERSHLSEIEFPLTPVKGRVQQPESGKSAVVAQVDGNLVQITGVQLNPTEMGLDIILETSEGVALQAETRSEDNTLIADIPNAVLLLPEGEAFRQDNPVEGIASVIVTQQDVNSIRVTVTGTETIPTAEVMSSASGLVFSLTTAPDTAEMPPDAPEEIEIVVTAEPETGYRVPRATTGTRTDTPIRDVPQSIQVIPQEVIEDRQVTRLSELADNVSGVQPSVGYGGLPSNQTFIRGFRSGVNLRDGFRDFGFLSPRDVSNIERVEFLRGPASVLYGNLEPGGIVNTVTEQPLPYPFYEVSMTVGNYDFYRPTIDLTGPLTENRELLYRLNVAYENADSYRDFNENESIFIAPVLTWNIGPRTTLTTEVEYQNYNYVFDRGFRPEPEFLELPRSRFLGEPDFNDAEVDSFFGSYSFQHEFSDNWKFRQGFSAIIVNNDIREVNLRPLEDDRRTLPRRASMSDESQENYTLQNEFIAELQTGSIGHQILFGLDLSRYEFTYDFFGAPLASIDIFDPEYGAEPGDFEPSFAEEYGSNTIAFYMQDLIEVLPQLKILVGGRLDWSDIFYRNRFTDESINDLSEFAFSPRAGIVYQPTDSTSLYFSWAKSFNPQFFSRSRTDEAFEPERGEQFEIGVKQEFLDGRLAANLALYEITKQNVLTPDPIDPIFSIQAGEQTSRGIELEIVGEILPGWNIIATYAHTDAFVSEDNTIPEGDRLVGIPLNSASLWTTYEIQQGGLQGLGFGVGVFFVGDREARLPNTGLEIPSYVRADARLSYRRDNWQAAVNFKNLFNTEYYETQGFFLTPQAPFTILGTIAVEF
ncbi:TonB-dependent siderophore receptor [Coleofasciculus sp. E2-BRE-01]|uniref:TonB-dependent siderophore receptor n=1 Tax=Coleofasciculus sp. E2-BRE-01 TaxID=3069524 RepID=UPI0032FB1708